MQDQLQKIIANAHQGLSTCQTLEELKENIKDAIKCHFDKRETPLFVHLHIIKEEKFACA